MDVDENDGEGRWWDKIISKRFIDKHFCPFISRCEWMQ